VHVGAAEVPVDGADGQTECLRQQFELEVHLDEPVDQDAAHLLVDVRLLLHVVAVGLVVQFGLEAVGVHVHGLQRAVECIQRVFHVARLFLALEVDRVHHTGIPLVHEVGVLVLLDLYVV